MLVPANQLFEEFYKCPECKELFFFSFCLQKVLKYDDYWHWWVSGGVLWSPGYQSFSNKFSEVCHKCQDVNTWHWWALYLENDYIAGLLGVSACMAVILAQLWQCHLFWFYSNLLAIPASNAPKVSTRRATIANWEVMSAGRRSKSL